MAVFGSAAAGPASADGATRPAGPAQAERTRQSAEQLASKLPPLMVDAERVAATVVQGVHGRRRVGQGEAFWQFRRYQPGDQTSAIDWRLTARGRHVFVRENEWEAAQSVWLWRDASGSMDYASSRTGPSKRHRAELLLLAAAALLLRGGERVALLGASAPAAGRAALGRLALALAAQAADPALPASISVPRYGQLVMIGDFLAPLETLQAEIGGYAARGVHGHLLQILDPAELTLPFQGRLRFEGLEAEGSLIVRRTESLRGDYARRLEAHCAGLAELARAAGWSYGRHSTASTPESALLWLYMALAGPDRW